MVTGTIDHQTGTRDIRRIPPLGPRWRWTVAAGVVAAASMAGVPLAFGFIAKEAAYESMLHGGFLGSSLVAAGIVAGSMLTAAYSARVIWALAWTPRARIGPERGAALRRAAVTVVRRASRGAVAADAGAGHGSGDRRSVGHSRWPGAAPVDGRHEPRHLARRQSCVRPVGVDAAGGWRALRRPWADQQGVGEGGRSAQRNRRLLGVAARAESCGRHRHRPHPERFVAVLLGRHPRYRCGDTRRRAADVHVVARVAGSNDQPCRDPGGGGADRGGVRRGHRAQTIFGCALPWCGRLLDGRPVRGARRTRSGPDSSGDRDIVDGAVRTGAAQVARPLRAAVDHRLPCAASRRLDVRRSRGVRVRDHGTRRAHAPSRSRRRSSSARCPRATAATW